ncbi:transposase [Pseudomonas savastanoi pv. retacarpa]|uniref:TniB family NTP-binding protein n=1 Tax=Pseudomonas savastanoi TaxID=29438 RepID=UPI0006E70C2C|nr:TniB family NTP-binding protein [Pseudomonas savastanoi]KPY50381.1 Transposition helper protein [Pseudomonas savastanoi pv. retacarpa]OSR27550.1 transposase [Pseudomonas savastanoi pv. retacarpa]
MNQYNHIHPDFQPVMAKSAQGRIDFLYEQRWIGYPAAQKLIDLMHHLMTVPKRPRMPNLLVVGSSNNGKTTIIERFVTLHSKGYVDSDGCSVKPVISVEAPPSADERSLYCAILEKFWTPYRPTDVVPKLRFQVIHQMRNNQVRLFIIDEFHSMLAGTAIKQREIMNVIKLLCNEFVIPVVGVGTEDAVRVLHTDPQHASRFDVFPLRNWELNVDFQRFLKGFESVLPLREPSGLAHPDLASLLHTISQGNTGDLHRLLIECATEAMRSGKEKIDADIIKSKSWVQPTRGIRQLL